jgi:hypothetical protein
MHRPGYVQGGQEASFGYLLLGVYYRRIPGSTTFICRSFKIFKSVNRFYQICEITHKKYT